MIVKKSAQGTMTMINQTDHAKMCGIFAAHWGNSIFAQPARRQSVMRAAAFHDQAWHRYETSPVYDLVTKESPSFNQSKHDAQQMSAYGEAIDWLTAIDPYAGLLISLHRTGLYRGRYGSVVKPALSIRAEENTNVAAFIEKYEASQAEAMTTFDKSQVLVDYQLLQFWDILSLRICMNGGLAETFEYVPENYQGDGKDGVPVSLAPIGDDTYRLSPYPFDQSVVDASFIYRQLPTDRFDSQAEFHAAYFGAAPKLQKVLIVE